MKMLFGVAGIYGAFMYYGVLQEGVTKWENDAGERLGRAWFLNTLEALANVIIGAIGLMVTGGANMKAISFQKFFLTGGAQVRCALLALCLRALHAVPLLCSSSNPHNPQPFPNHLGVRQIVHLDGYDLWRVVPGRHAR